MIAQDCFVVVFEGGDAVLKAFVCGGSGYGPTVERFSLFFGVGEVDHFSFPPFFFLPHRTTTISSSHL